MRKISKRAQELLLLVEQQTEMDWETGTLTRYYIPRGEEEYVTRCGGSIGYVSGSGDASIFRALEKAGLIRHVQRPSGMSGKYDYALTEDGLLACQKIPDPE